MSIYIIQPVHPLVERSSLAPASSRFTLDFRREQIDLAKSSQNLDLIQETIINVTRYSSRVNEAFSRETLALRNNETPIKNVLEVTGSIIVDITQREAELLRQALPDTLVLPNRSLNLIEPIKPVTASVKPDVTESDLWHLNAIGLQEARSNGFTGLGEGITIAVLDTGIDPTHPELADGRLAGSFTFDEEGNAQQMISSKDTNGHGTHVAALICGKKVGIAPKAQVINALMIPAGIATVASFYNAINWAAKNPQVQIVNISAGIRGFEEEMRPAIEALLSVGVLPVVAVGNEGRDRTRSPGNYNEVVSVGASSQENLVGGISGSGTIIFNNQQYNVPDIVAPGIQVYSAVRGGYEAWDGTSMAAPIVSGVAALILQKRPNISVIELMDELFSTCKKLTGVSPSRQGNGLIQVTAAL